MDIRLSQADISDHSWDFPGLVNKESFDLDVYKRQTLFHVFHTTVTGKYRQL